MIRPYRNSDARFLAPIHTAVFPSNPLSFNAFSDYVTSALGFGGNAWVIEGDSPLGYALVVPVPGLPHIVELNGCIAPPYQRRGLGGRLLNHLLTEQQGTAVRQVSHQVIRKNSPAARFLIKNNFYVEHEETIMRRNSLDNLPRPSTIEGATIITLSRPDAVHTFSQLYAASFSGLPWDQPFSRDDIETELEHAEDILFLTLNARPIAFAWLHLKRNGLGIIEPLGVLPEVQGQGFGRSLLSSALQKLFARGATQAQIGAWCTNQPAITLYQSLGFKHHQTITFLATDL